MNKIKFKNPINNLIFNYNYLYINLTLYDYDLLFVLYHTICY